MFRPILIGSALVSLLSAPAGPGRAVPGITDAIGPASPGTGLGTDTPGRMAPPLPAWVEERRAQLGIREMGLRGRSLPAWPTPPSAPDWVGQAPQSGARKHRRCAMCRAAPEAPTWVIEQRPRS